MKHLSNWYTYQTNGNTAVEPESKKPSMTVPGMTLSVQELLKRFVRGETVTTFDPIYTDEDIPDNLEHMTEIERLEMATNIRAAIEDYRSTPPSKPKQKPDPEPQPAPPSDPVLAPVEKTD